MPRVISCQDKAVYSVAECADALEHKGFDPQDEESLGHATLCLRRLGNDRAFIGDIMLDELKNRHRQTQDSAYGAQALVLTKPANGFFLRANIWPSEQDQMFHTTGAHNFAYGAPHDHNFDFLTLGYFGPGYESDYYEYDHEAVAGYRGEEAGLRFVERVTLDPGKLMLYRAHRDVHSQIPPRSMSVSLNIMSIDAAQSWRDQYAFDLENNRITRPVSPTSTEVFLRAAIALGSDESCDLAEHFGRHHPVDRIRLASFHARGLAAKNTGERDHIWREAENSGSLLVSREAKRFRAELV